mmetsp:Transcript_72890/g.193613  ORF Transcript_72890/g.193613 Transcript_72890/m.193613 type:complete len:301 (+) Transcript_72890:491-1393(+)
MSAMRPLTFPKGSSPACAPDLATAAMRAASCASAVDCCLWAKSRMKRTASKLARSIPEESPVRDSCTRATWLRPYESFPAPAVISEMTFFASARALSSSLRLLVSASKSSALVMQLWWRSASVVVSSLSSPEVTFRSPSEVAFRSPLAARPCLASASSLAAYFIASSRLCFRSSKLCSELVSFFRASPSCSSAFSWRSSRVPTIPPLWPSYTVAAGAPRLPSSACWELWISAVSCFASAEVSAEASTSTPRASAMLFAPCNCIIDAPPFCISFSRMPTARCSVSMTSASSACSTEKSLAS